jgi:hypothetical protein
MVNHIKAITLGSLLVLGFTCGAMALPATAKSAVHAAPAAKMTNVTKPGAPALARPASAGIGHPGAPVGGRNVHMTGQKGRPNGIQKVRMDDHHGFKQGMRPGDRRFGHGGENRFGHGGEPRFDHRFNRR